MSKKEAWKPILGYEGLYEISNTGKVKSLSQTGPDKYRGRRKKKERILSSSNKNGWYLQVSLCKEKKAKTHSIHTLVARHFVKKIIGKNHVNHKDLNKQNNNYLNLEWVTQLENNIHAIRFRANLINLSFK